MERGTQRKLSQLTGLSTGYVSEILSGKKRPTWNTAKIIAATTGTDPVLWMDGTPEQIRDALQENRDDDTGRER